MARSEPGVGRLAFDRTAYRYGEVPVLRDVSFEVAAGEVVGLLGPNGSGKSTLVRTASGVLRDYAGRVAVDGRDVKEIAPRELARRVAVVPQEPRFGFPFTALEVVLMGRHPHLEGWAFESSRDVATAREALEVAGAAAFADRPVQQLSSGERQRVVFARALAQHPDVLLLDEPASFLDVRHQVELYDRVRDLAEAGTAVLTILHDLNLAAEYCDRLVLLREGEVLAAGPVDAVFTYANLKATFDAEVYVDVNHLTGRLLAVPFSRRARERLHENSPETPET